MKWQLDVRKHSHKLSPVRISTDNMFAITLYAPVLLISTIELISSRSKSYDFVYSSRYSIGFLTAGILTSVIKIIVSRPRPNAIEYEASMKHKTDKKQVHISRQSFLSGHAFGGVFASTFTSLFLVQMFPSIPLPFVALLFASGLYPGLTQAIDHWHHASDVLSGYGYGLATALLSFCYV